MNQVAAAHAVGVRDGRVMVFLENYEKIRLKESALKFKEDYNEDHFTFNWHLGEEPKVKE